MVIANNIVFQFYRLPTVPTDFRIYKAVNLKRKKFFAQIKDLKLADATYRLYQLEDIKSVLKLHRWAEMEYIKEIRDCDDYTWSVVAHLKKLLPGICAGMIWVDVLRPDGTIGYKHSLSFVVDYNGTTYYLEPQSNRLYSPRANMRPYFAVI